jgi:hypothetical protein
MRKAGFQKLITYWHIPAFVQWSFAPILRARSSRRPSRRAFTPILRAHPSRPSFAPDLRAHPSRPTFAPILRAQPSRPSFAPILRAHPSRPSFAPDLRARPSRPSFAPVLRARPSRPSFAPVLRTHGLSPLSGESCIQVGQFGGIRYQIIVFSSECSLCTIVVVHDGVVSD